MMTLPVNLNDQVTGDAALDLPYVVTGDDSVVVIDNKDQQWPVFWANIKTVVEQGGLPPTFSNLDIPEKIPYLRDTFPKMWNAEQDQISDHTTWHKMFESIAGCKADGNRTMRRGKYHRVICVEDPSTSPMKLKFHGVHEQPFDPREPAGQTHVLVGEDNFLGVKLASDKIKAKRSAFKPRVFLDDVNVDRLPSFYLCKSVSVPDSVKKTVRRIFDSKRRCQWTLADTQYVQIESPIKLIRYLTALGFEPCKLKPTGSMMVGRSHSVSFLAEYKGALFCFSNGKHNHYDVWNCRMCTDSKGKQFAPYSIPGFEFGDYHYDKKISRYNPGFLDMGSFNFIGSRGVPAPLERMMDFSRATTEVKRRHDTRPFRYGLQIRYRWRQCFKLVQQIMGEAMQDFQWECSTIPGPSLLHLVIWSRMPANLRFTLEATKAIHERIDQWAEQYDFIQAINVQFGASTSEVSSDPDGLDFSRCTPFAVNIHMPDVTPPEEQATAMTALFVELPGIIEGVVQDDPNNCQ